MPRMDSLSLPKAPRKRSSSSQLDKHPSKRTETEFAVENHQFVGGDLVADQQFVGGLVAEKGDLGSEDTIVLTEEKDQQDMEVTPQNWREDSQGERKDVASFSRLANELQNQIWEESFSQRIFDNDTLKLLKPQDGIMYSYLTPYALYVCPKSREFALRRLRRSFLFRSWPKKSGRVIYFRPEYDLRIYESTQLHWQPDGQCLFDCVKIIANVSPEELTGNTGHGLRSVEFHEKFPNLKRLIVTSRQVDLHREVFRNRWTEEHWKRESSLNQNDWDRDWKAVEKPFEEREIRIKASSDLPETNEDKKRYIEGFQACPVTRGVRWYSGLD